MAALGTGDITGGYDVARLAVSDNAVVVHRGHLVAVTPQTRDRYVQVWLQVHGHDDIADALGLTEAGQCRRRPPVGVVRVQVPLPERQCNECGDFFRPRVAEQPTCSRKCGAARAARTRTASDEPGGAL